MATASYLPRAADAASQEQAHEYLSAVKVSVEADRLLRLLIEKQLDRPVTPFDIDESCLAILGLIRRKRVGWLAHWTAACYFSRAAQAAELKHPEEATWRKYEERSREQVSLGLSRNPEPRDWRQYCEDMAIQEIGRVIRNPCHQLNPELLHTDPDMKPLEARTFPATGKTEFRDQGGWGRQHWLGGRRSAVSRAGALIWA
jgi:hypothetical protein